MASSAGHARCAATSSSPSLTRRARSQRAGLSRVIVQTADVRAIEALVAVARAAGSGRRLTGIRRSRRRAPGRTSAGAGRAPRRCGPSASTGASTARSSGPARPSAPRWVTENLGVDGTGVGVAIIDSGVTRAHDDLGGNRVVHFVDFVDFQPQPHDGYGHGTHVAGIIAGSGLRLGRRPARHRARRAPRRAEGARRAGRRLHQQRHRGDRLRDRAARGLQHPRHQPVGRGRRVRVLQDRPADARGQARGRGRHRRRHRRRQPRARTPKGAAAVRRHHRARAMPRGS